MVKNSDALFFCTIQPGAVPYRLRTAVYMSNFARTATKLYQNVFQTIPYVSFFDVGNFFGQNLFKDFWRSRQNFEHDFLVLEKLECFERHHQILLEK